MSLCELAAIVAACAFGSALLLYLGSRANLRDAVAMYQDATTTYQQATTALEKAREINAQCNAWARDRS